MGDLEPRWLEQALKGDDYAFTRIVEQYQKPVYSLCYRMLGNAQDAEDAAQETFLRSYKSLGKYDRRRSFSTWLLSIGAHYCIDQMRRKRLKMVSIEEMPIPEIADKSPGIEAKLGREEENRQIREVLQILNPTDRACVVLYYWHELSYEEICQSLLLSPAAVKSRLHRARRAMAKQWIEIKNEPVLLERMAS